MRAYSEAPWRVEIASDDEKYWHVDPDDYRKVVDGTGEIVCDNMDYYPCPVDLKNMPVIAAAPEMLELLEELIPICFENLVGGYGELIDRGETLIKKAKETLP